MELTEELMQEQLDLYKKMQETLKELSELQHALWDKTRPEMEWRNTPISFWTKICEKYDCNDLLNAYGDIFFITEKHENLYFGHRVLWNLCLSEEKYCIEEIVETDIDGEYDNKWYNVKVVLNTEA